MAYTGSGSGGGYDDVSGIRAEVRESGGRRRKLAGYLKAANEIRQSYFNQDSAGYAARDFAHDSGIEGGAFPDAAVVRSGNEEMILFPSYARQHTKSNPAPAAIDEDIGEEEYWRREWERHQDDKAIVDVDVRGWIYTPHKGQTTRKQRLFIGLARQLTGLPAPPAARPGDPASSQTPSRVPSPHREKKDEELIAREAENIIKKGEKKQQYARRGAFSEAPVQDLDSNSLHDISSRSSSRHTSPDRDKHRLSQVSLASSADEDLESMPPLQKRATWPQVAHMTTAELATANNHLLSRLRLFMANPVANSAVSAFFYNEFASRQHTVYTNAAGHFSCRAALDFVPTHVRVLAGEKLSATEEVTITNPRGVSLISDIDDTIKHSGIIAGAREIFRNAFIRELDDLTVDGVREWYNTLSDMGVQLHYVSNSPWQMYPILTSFFKMAHLPRGSFHLKQYSGMLQGIFEPVAERKKSSLEKIMGDFPERKFILVGDSGEADLEVYTDVVVDNPGRVLGIFIRDVTTPVKSDDYFSPSNGSTGGGRHHSDSSATNSPGNNATLSRTFSRRDAVQDDDADLKAAIAASLADMEEEARNSQKPNTSGFASSENVQTQRPRPRLPARQSTERTITQVPISDSPEEDLIDFSDDPPPKQTRLAPPARANTVSNIFQANTGAQSKPPPSPPPKPEGLRSPSPTGRQASPTPENPAKSPPPRPRKPSSAVKPPPSLLAQPAKTRPHMPQRPQTMIAQHQPSPLSQMTPLSPPPQSKPKPPLPTRRKDDGTMPRGYLASAQKALNPVAYWHTEAIGPPRSKTPTPGGSSVDSLRTLPSSSTKSMENLRSYSMKAPAPAPPPRLRNKPSFTGAAGRKATNRLSSGWDDGAGGNLPGTPAEAGMSKKEFLWNQRWARAKSILDRQGVTLRSWRVGSDVADVCVRLAEHAIRDAEKETRRA